MNPLFGNILTSLLADAVNAGETVLAAELAKLVIKINGKSNAPPPAPALGPQS